MYRVTEIFVNSEEATLSQLTFSLEDSHASLSALPDDDSENQTPAGSGRISHDSFARYNRDGRYWKTPQDSFLPGWDQFSETWPKAGTMQNGVCYRQPNWERRISVIESGLWPTPQSRDYRSGEGHRWLDRENRSRNLNDAVAYSMNYKMTPDSQPIKGGGQLNPQWVEWLMGYPIGWTDLEDSATPSSHKSSNTSDDAS
jgi:hypothetical protein